MQFFLHCGAKVLQFFGKYKYLSIFFAKKTRLLFGQSRFVWSLLVELALLVGLAKGLIFVLLSCFVLFDEFFLYIAWYEFVALEAHGKGSTTTSET